MAEKASELNTELLSGKSPFRTLIAMAVPGVTATVINGIYSLGDAFFVGRIGPNAISAVTLIFPLLAVLGGIGSAFSSGSASLMSRQFGSGAKGQGIRTAMISLTASALIGGSISLVLVLLRRPVVSMFGGGTDAVEQALPYATIILPGSVLTLVNMNLMGITRARGNPVRAMVVQSCGALLNLVLDPLFIFTFALGVPGAAWATVVSQAMVTGVLSSELIAAGRRSSSTSLGPASTPSSVVHTVKRIVTIGAPSIFSYALITVGSGALIRIAAQYGDDVIAVAGIALRVYSFAIFPLYGVVQGFIPPAGFAFGSGNKKRLRGLIAGETTLILLFCGILSAIALVFPRGISSFFFSSPELINLSADFLRRLFIFFPILGLVLGITALYQVTGHLIRAISVTIVRLGVLFAPLMLVMTALYGPVGIAASQTVADILSVVFLIDCMILLKKEL